MKAIISIAIIIILAVGGWNLYQYWGNYSEDGNRPTQETSVTSLDPNTLSGLPEKLAGPLEIARKRGGPGLRDWLEYYRKDIQDPRLAWIELDCCVLLIQTDPVEAKKIFHDVQARLSPSSPVYPRLKQLEAAFK
jgi:hypothetical protein